MKLCRDCKHCTPTKVFPWGVSYKSARCNVTVSQYDLVSGEHTQELCYYARFNGRPCGPTGRLWEAK